MTTTKTSDWTIDPATNRTNSSDGFKLCCRLVEDLLRGSGPALVNGGADNVAILIMAQLAHVAGLAPTEPITLELMKKNRG